MAQNVVAIKITIASVWLIICVMGNATLWMRPTIRSVPTMAVNVCMNRSLCPIDDNNAQVKPAVTARPTSAVDTACNKGASLTRR